MQQFAKDIKSICGYIKKKVGILCTYVIQLISLMVLFPCCIIARYRKKKINIGLGPDPLVSNIYFKKALIKAGYTAETFVIASNYIADEYDYDFSKRTIPKIFKKIYLKMGIFIWMIFRFQCIYIYFNGGPLGSPVIEGRWNIVRKLEPLLLKLARIKILVISYGGDVYTFSECNSLFYRYLMHQDYPKYYNVYQQRRTKNNVKRWCKYADYILSGGDNVYYIPFCGDKILMNFLCIDTELFYEIPYQDKSEEKPFTIMHAVNHRAIKGSDFFERAIVELKEEGLNIEFLDLFQVPGKVVHEAMKNADVVADQLILGIYGMFAIEAMAMGKPVICYIDPKIEELMIIAGDLEPGEIPLVQATPLNVKEKIKELYFDREKLKEIGKKSRDYTEKHHSLDRLSNVFDEINKQIL